MEKYKTTKESTGCGICREMRPTLIFLFMTAFACKDEAIAGTRSNGGRDDGEHWRIQNQKSPTTVLRNVEANQGSAYELKSLKLGFRISPIDPQAFDLVVEGDLQPIPLTAASGGVHPTMVSQKLSPVPPEVESGLSSPPVPEPELTGTQYEVHEAPAASSNFILQPTLLGTRPTYTQQVPSQKPQIYGTAGPYYINQQGNLVQRPHQRPQDTRPPPLNFHEAPPAFPYHTDEELYMLGQPVSSHQSHCKNNTAQGFEEAAQQGVISTSTEAGLVASQPVEPVTSTDHPPNPPSTSSETPVPPPPPAQLPPVSQSRPPGTYIATVNYGPNKPTVVYSCIPTDSVNPALSLSNGYIPGPNGYSCKTSKGRPLLANHILAANNQKPVSQPMASTEPVLLPTVVPIKFL